MRRERSRADRLLFLLPLLGLVVAGSVCIALRTDRLGPGVSPDSVHYMAIAESIVAGRGYRSYSGSPSPQWAPAYPSLLAAGPALGVAVAAWARALNVLGFALLIAAVGLALRASARSAGPALLGAAAVAVAPPLHLVYSFVWTETAFILWLAAFLVAAPRYLATGRRRDLLVLALIAGLACLTRYLGVALCAAALVLVAWAREGPDRSRGRHAWLLTAVALGPLALWLARNLVVSGTVSGLRAASPEPMRVHLTRLVSIALEWSVPLAISRRLQAAVVLAVVVTALVAIVAARRRPDDGRGRRLLTLAPALAACACYALAVTLAASAIAIDALDDRLLAPLFVPMVIVAALALDQVLAGPRRGMLAALRRWGLLAAAVGWVTVQAMAVVPLALQQRRAGAGVYTDARWVESETIARLRLMPTAEALYANDTDAVYLFTGRVARPAPRRPRPGAQEGLHDLGGLLRPDGPARILVWFDTQYRRDLVPLPELEPHVRLERLGRFSDGAIYRVEPR